MRKNKSTEENREYWTFVEQTAKTVSLWPAWKRGVSVDIYRSEDVKKKSEPKQQEELKP